MAFLTRIKNNQITDSTILANTKILPGSIVGSLFNADLTLTSNVTITGNLTVQGTSTYLTVASTNTYVNDPLIVLNNAFGGTNIYDIGLLFNRGDQTNTALIWNETNKQFQLIYTTETGTSYGVINNSGFANIKVGNLTVAGVTTTNDVNSGNITLTGNLAVNGGDLTTSAGTFNLINANATTVNFAGAATTANIGAGSGTITINNPTLVGLQATQNLYNTIATTMNFAGSATTLTIGATTGVANIRNANLYLPNATTIYSGQATVSLLNVNATTVNAFGAADTIIVGATTGVANIRNATTNIIGNATVGGALSVNANIITTSSSFNLATATATTVNAFNAASLVTIGSGTGTITLSNPTVVGTQPTQTLYNTVATTMNFAGAATALNVGASTGNTTVQNNLITTGNLNISATTESTSTASGALVLFGGIGIAKNLNVGGNVIVTGNLTVNGAVTTVNTATLDVTDLNITVAKGAVSSAAADGAGLTVDGASATILYTHATTSWNLNKHLIGTSAQFSTTLGVTGNATLTANLAVNGGNLTTTASTFNLVNATATTLNLGGDATTIAVGANSGTLTIGNPTLVGTQTTQNLYNTVATTVNAFGAATTTNIGAGTGVVTLVGNANILATTTSTAYTAGALKVAGGVGIAGNVHIKSTRQFIVGLDLPNTAWSANATAQFFSNISNYSAVTHQNTSANAVASSDFVVIADNGSEIDTYANFGIASSTYNLPSFAIIKPNDGYLITAGNLTTGGGNLIIGSMNNDILFFIGGPDSSNEVARFNNTYGNLQLKQTTDSVSSTTGALTVTGGAGFAKNVYVGKGTTINSTQSAENFTVKGLHSTALIYANSNTDSVVIGGGHIGGSSGNITIQPGVTLKIDATDTILLPVGTTSQRPGNSGNVDVAGMTRFNSSINNLEFFDGSGWVPAGTAFTIISDRQFSAETGNPFGNVNGVNSTFTIQSSSTTSSTIVSINGVVQIPALAYNISTTTLTFTEAPAVGDIIDVRCLATTTVVSALTSGNGMSQFIAENTEAQIWTGTGVTAKQFSIDTVGTATFEQSVLIKGKSAYDQTAVTVNTSVVVIDSFAKATYRTAKYILSISNSGTGEYESTEILVIHNGTTALLSEIATRFTGVSTLGTVTVAVNGANVELRYTGTGSGNAVKISATYIKV